MASIIMTAENFAFGPIGKLLHVADHLHRQGHKLIFAGYGTSYQLAKNFPFDEIYEIDTDSATSNNELSKIISQGDILVSSMDLSSVIIAKQLHKAVVWIDCLFWFWEEIFEQVLDVDLFVREHTLDDSVNEKKFKSKIKNFYSVGPILGKAYKEKRVSQALISYGGGEATYFYQVGRDTNYPYVMTSILSKHVDWSMFDRIIVATNQRISDDLKDKFTDSRFDFLCLPYDEFLHELARSEILLTTAGLVTTESAFQAKTPVLFLPSTNNAHYLLLDELRSKHLASASVEFSDFLGRIDTSDKSDKVMIPLMMKQQHLVEQSFEIQKKIGMKINQYVQERSSWMNDAVKDGNNFLISLGGDGTQQIVKKINQLIKNKDKK